MWTTKIYIDPEGCIDTLLLKLKKMIDRGFQGLAGVCHINTVVFNCNCETKNTAFCSP